MNANFNFIFQYRDNVLCKARTSLFIILKNISKILFMMFFFIITVLSLIKLMINKFTSYISTVLEHCVPQASYWKRKWLSLRKTLKTTDLDGHGSISAEQVHVSSGS
jgi:hypothetical protein